MRIDAGEKKRRGVSWKEKKKQRHVHRCRKKEERCSESTIYSGEIGLGKKTCLLGEETTMLEKALMKKGGEEDWFSIKGRLFFASLAKGTTAGRKRGKVIAPAERIRTDRRKRKGNRLKS